MQTDLLLLAGSLLAFLLLVVALCTKGDVKALVRFVGVTLSFEAKDKRR